MPEVNAFAVVTSVPAIVTFNVGDTTTRSKKIFNIVDDDNIDQKKTKQSVKANWAHFSDAEIVRNINSISRKPMLTIHDCFLVEMLYVSEFIEISNEVFRQTDEISLYNNKNVYKSIESLYIFI